MSRSDILECMLEVLEESMEWGLGEKDYGQFVDGVLAVTRAVLNKENNKNEEHAILMV